MENERPVKTGEQERKPKPKLKKPYSKPSFQFERVFETQALTCGKISSFGSCHLNRKNS
ncbi:MAG TPA: hypothetical protein VL983_10530 [Terriglobales bacterium]|nr:hypothetical protein [Terriglobales bacterium]